MAKKSISHGEKVKTNEWQHMHHSFKKVVTSALLWALLLTGCDSNVPTNQMILNKEKQSITFGVVYKHDLWSAWEEKTNYNIIVSKTWDTYTWLITEKEGRSKKTTSFTSNDMNTVFNQISDALDDYQMSDNTLNKKNKKLKVAKHTYKDIIFTRKDTPETWDIIVQYNPN